MRRIRLGRIAIIIVVWTALGAVLTLYDHFLLQSHISGGFGARYSFVDALAFNLFSGTFGGLLGGIVLMYINHRMRGKPYVRSVALVVVFFVLIVSVITLLTAAGSTFFTFDRPFSDPAARDWFLDRILTTLHLKNIIFWAMVVALTMFAIQISDKFGPGNLWKIVVGKYHLPKEEQRIVMFLDLKSSTAIAEQLGDRRYHRFLADVFADITDPIIDSDAEIYQYVGDEVVICWKATAEDGNENCLTCFFAIERELQRRSERYLANYRVLPEFKAGAHCGNVVAGEVGIIKRDITYSGDVLNTAARIRGQCAPLESSLLISGSLRDLIDPDPRRWNSESKGAIPLKGKSATLELLSVSKAEPQFNTPLLTSDI